MDTFAALRSTRSVFCGVLFVSVKSTSLHYLSATLKYRHSIKPFTFRTISSKRQAVNDCYQYRQRRSQAKTALSNLTVYLMLRKQGVKQKLRQLQHASHCGANPVMRMCRPEAESQRGKYTCRCALSSAQTG